MAAPIDLGPTDQSTPAMIKTGTPEVDQRDTVDAGDRTAPDASIETTGLSMLDETAEPTESGEPTDGPVDPTQAPTDEPTQDASEEPTPDPSEEPTEGPTGEPTVLPTDDDWPEMSRPPAGMTGGGVSDPWAPAEQPRLSRAPIFAPIPTITAQSRAEVSDVDLWYGVRVRDDVDLRLSPTISDWGDWYNATECPNGFPCTYRILYLVTDSDGNAAEATRDIIITGRAMAAPVDERGDLPPEQMPELPPTGVGNWGIFLAGMLLLACGTGLLISSRRTQSR